MYLRPVSGYTRKFYQKTIKKEKKKGKEKEGKGDREKVSRRRGRENYLCSSLHGTYMEQIFGGSKFTF